jgi:hypothetical protein
MERNSRAIISLIKKMERELALIKMVQILKAISKMIWLMDLVN